MLYLTSNFNINLNFNFNSTLHFSRISDLIKLINVMSESQKNYEEIQKIYFPTKNNVKNVFMNFMNQIQKNVDDDRPYYENCDYIQ